MRLFKNIKKAMESGIVFCGTLLKRRTAKEEEVRRGGVRGGNDEVGDKARRGGNLQGPDALAAKKGR